MLSRQVVGSTGPFASHSVGSRLSRRGRLYFPLSEPSSSLCSTCTTPGRASLSARRVCSGSTFWDCSERSASVRSDMSAYVCWHVLQQHQHLQQHVRHMFNICSTTPSAGCCQRSSPPGGCRGFFVWREKGTRAPFGGVTPHNNPQQILVFYRNHPIRGDSLEGFPGISLLLNLY